MEATPDSTGTRKTSRILYCILGVVVLAAVLGQQWQLSQLALQLEDVQKQQALQPSPPNILTEADGAPTTEPLSNPVLSYPEQSEVDVLLYRAQDLKDGGQFKSALAVVDETLKIDPHSPAATTLRQQLVKIITRI